MLLWPKTCIDRQAIFHLSALHCIVTAKDLDILNMLGSPACAIGIMLYFFCCALCAAICLIWLCRPAGFDTKIYAHSCHSWNSIATMVGQEVLFFPDWLTSILLHSLLGRKLDVLLGEVVPIHTIV